MPTVPTYDQPQVQPQQLGDARATDAGFGAAIDTASQQGTDLSNAVSGATNTAFNIQMDMQRQANQLRVDDALNQAREASMNLTYDPNNGYQALKGQAALQRPGGQPLSQEYTSTLTDQLGGIASNLGNDAQRRAFQEQTAPLVTQFQAGVMQHETQQFQTYAQSVATGTIETRQREIGLSWNNPDAVDQAVQSIKAQAYQLARLTGQSATWADAQATKLASNAHVTAIGAALQNNNPVYADQYLKAHAGEMDANDILQANGLITKQLDAQIGSTVGNQIVSQAIPAIQPSDMGRLTNLVAQFESGGKETDANGNTITSPVGAQGVMQVMPATGANPGFGVKPSDGTPADTARAGRDYLAAMLKNYQGNVPQALAAYNAGPGNVDDAIKQATAAGTPANWMNYLPKPQETIPYVTGIIKQYAAGAGAAPMPTLFDLNKQVDALIPPALAERNKAAKQVVEQQYNDMLKAQKQTADNNVAQAQSALIANGGKFTDLPLNVRANIPPGQYDDLVKFATKVAAGQPVDTNWQLYYQLKTNPQLLGQTNLMSLRDKLADPEFKQLTDQQADITAGKTNNLTDVSSARDVINGYMRQAGIDPTPKDTDADGAGVVGRILNQFQATVNAQETNLGRKLKPDEVNQAAASLFTPVNVSTWFGMSSKPVGAAAVKPGQQLVVPDADRAQITAALAQAGQPVTDTAIQNLYRRRMGVAPLQ